MITFSSQRLKSPNIWEASASCWYQPLFLHIGSSVSTSWPLMWHFKAAKRPQGALVTPQRWPTALKRTSRHNKTRSKQKERTRWAGGWGQACRGTSRYTRRLGEEEEERWAGFHSVCCTCSVTDRCPPEQRLMSQLYTAFIKTMAHLWFAFDVTTGTYWVCVAWWAAS